MQTIQTDKSKYNAVVIRREELNLKNSVLILHP
jgi:hypothetical protein